jgi:hypothetical protein
MGLDVYLYRYDDFAATKEAEAKAEAFSETAWNHDGKKYEEMSDAEKEESRSTCAAFNASIGLDQWGDDKTRKQKIELPSAKYPDHYFKIGYFRSSYNEGGINSIARNAIGMELGDIFPAHEEYCFQPDWSLARESAVEFHRRLAAAPTLRVSTVDAIGLFDGQSKVGAPEALSIVQRERGGWQTRNQEWGSYSNRDGNFYVKPFPIIAAVPGSGLFGGPCVHLVYDDAEGFAWYVNAAEIIIETIDYVLAQPDREKYWLHWSG